MTHLPQERPVARWVPPHIPPALKLACKQRIAECTARYNAAGTRLPMPTVSFDLKGKTAGKAFLERNHVQLNAVLLTENAEEFIEQTVGHEVAHLATHARYGHKAQAHGAEWKQMMRLIGLEPHRCHSFDTSNSAVSKASFRYLCGCQEHLLTARRHALARRRGYGCKRCGKPLRFVPAGTAAPVPPQPFVRVPPPARPLRLPPATPPSRRGPPDSGSPAPRPTGAPVRPPTDAMVRFARDLARSRSLMLTPDILASFDAVSRFIEQAKAVPVGGGSSALRGTPVEAPTERQLSYARHLAQRTGLALAEDVLRSRAALSAWIDRAVLAGRS